MIYEIKYDAAAFVSLGRHDAVDNSTGTTISRLLNGTVGNVGNG